jgi:hypothetical protein
VQFLRSVITASALCILWCIPIAGAEDRKLYEIPKTEDEIKVDAVLDEAAWQMAVQIEAPYETEPGDNTPAKARTQCMLMYDTTHIYAACRAFDSNPSAIRAFLWDRDRMMSDDWVGFYFDTFNSERRGYTFFVNPLGVQGDEVRDEVSGSFDGSFDAIWDSAARLTDEGYVVELAIPFSQLRFQKTKEGQTWGFGIVRQQPRDRIYRSRSQPWDRDVDCFLCQLSTMYGFTGVEPGRNLELDPTVTGLRSEGREEIDGPVETTENFELGLTAIWGFSPNSAVAATINPDFSQVEADVAQLGINQRFALFFPERRPFFMEGADYFDTPINAVYTRTMVSPDWGVKLTGKEGRNAFGVYAVEDDVTSLLFPGSESSNGELFEQGNRTGIFRYRRDIGKNSTLGALVTGRDGDGYSNLVYGIDGTLWVTKSDIIRFQGLGSQTEYPEEIQDEYDQPDGTLQDTALLIDYSHHTENWDWGAVYEDLGNDFRADSGFVPRVGVRTAHARLARVWRGDDTNWYTRNSIGGDLNYSEDQDGNLLGREVEVSWRFEGGMQSRSFIEYEQADEVFQGELFPDLQGVRFSGSFYPSNNLRLGLSGNIGDQVDYANSQAGDEINILPNLNWRPGTHWEIDLNHEYKTLDVAGGRLFTANLSQIRLVYYLNVRTFFRAIVQHTDIERNPSLYEDEVKAHETRLFTQLLFSYKLNPRTVVFVGYSDTTDSNDILEDVAMNRSVFIKLGYAWLL